MNSQGPLYKEMRGKARTRQLRMAGALAGERRILRNEWISCDWNSSDAKECGTGGRQFCSLKPAHWQCCRWI